MVLPVNPGAGPAVLKNMGHREIRVVAAGPGQAVAAGLHLLLLAALAGVAGLGPYGLLAGVAYAAGLLGLLSGAMSRAGRAALGPADLVTLGRALLVGGVTALVVDALLTGVPATTAIVALAAVALALDAVDGQVARRTGTTSPLGARFDMEVDAYLILVLSVYVAGLVGPWALGIGAMRYGFVLAGQAWPWLQGTLPPSYAAKTVAAAQGVALVVVSAGVLAHPAAVALVAAALLLLCWSFGRDVVRLRRDARTGAVAGPERPGPVAGPGRAGNGSPQATGSAVTTTLSR